MELTLSEVKPIIKYIIERNKELELENKFPIALSLCSECGIGKTSLIEQIAQEMDCNFVKINLAQITEPGD